MHMKTAVRSYSFCRSFVVVARSLSFSKRIVNKVHTSIDYNQEKQEAFMHDSY